MVRAFLSPNAQFKDHHTKLANQKCLAFMDFITIPKDLRFINVGEDPPHPKPFSNWVGRRQWDACVEYSFVSAGQELNYSKPLLNFQIDDVLAAYISGYGYVGIGIVKEKAIPIKNFKFKNSILGDFNVDDGYITGSKVSEETVDGAPYLRKTLFRNSNNEKSEYAVRVEWKKVVTKQEAYWEKNNGLFASRLIQCNLKNQLVTINFLQKCFDIEFC